MTYITEEEEHYFDNMTSDTVILLERNNAKFKIKRNQVYCYGIVNFNNKSDYKQIKEFNFLGYLGVQGIPIPANYNYKEHNCKTSNRRIQYTETWCPAELSRYAHACLGKPERIIIFKQ